MVQHPKNRNLSSYTYDEALAEQIYAFVGQEALPALTQLQQKASTW